MEKYGSFEKKGSILYVTYPGFEPAVEQYKVYLLEQESHLKSADKLTIIYDTSNSKYLSAENRALQSRWINENKELLKAKVTRMIFVIPSIAVRLVLKTILAFSPLPCPHLVVTNLGEAEKNI